MATAADCTLLTQQLYLANLRRAADYQGQVELVPSRRSAGGPVLEYAGTPAGRFHALIAVYGDIIYAQI